MTREELYEALTDVDPAYVLSSAPQPSRGRRLRLQRWSALAACICLVVTLLQIGPLRVKNKVYSAHDAGALFPAVNADGITNYTEVCVPNADSLYLNTDKVPNKLKVYRYNGSGEGVDEKEFSKFADRYLPKMAQLFGFPLREYVIEYDKWLYDDNETLHIDQDHKVDGDYVYNLGATQYEGIHRVSIFGYSEHDLLLNGEVIRIDQRNSDEQIIASLSTVKNTIFKAMRVSFSDAKVVRSYDAYSEHGVTSISVYFYNEKGHALNRYLEYPVSDYIRVDFDNHHAGMVEERSASVLVAESVEYIQLRSKVSRTYEIDGKTKTLSIQEAEQLLEEGYVFGYHPCRLCMEAQEAVSFEDYDYVSLTYLCSYSSWTPRKDTLILPFYAFYKEIGVGKNGNIIYAQTYVPAIPLEDLEEYFTQQEKKHR